MDALVSSIWLAHAGSSRTAMRILDTVVERYREPHRRYHGVSHLERVVADVGRLLATTTVDDPAAVVFAAFFHDAIYVPTANDNEAASAALARRRLTELESAPTTIDETCRLILLTASHLVATDTAAAILLDADLAVLGADPAAYATYVRGVRDEYAHVGDDAWRIGRSEVLQSFLDRPTIYVTAAMRPSETRARANLAGELRALQR